MNHIFEDVSRKLKIVATLPWMAKYWQEHPENSFLHSQIRDNNWIERKNPVMKDLKEIVANSPKIQWIYDKVITRLRRDEKLVIISQFCLVADIMNEVCSIFLLRVFPLMFCVANNNHSRVRDRKSYLKKAILISI